MTHLSLLKGYKAGILGGIAGIGLVMMIMQQFFGWPLTKDYPLENLGKIQVKTADTSCYSLHVEPSKARLVNELRAVLWEDGVALSQCHHVSEVEDHQAGHYMLRHRHLRFSATDCTLVAVARRWRGFAA